MIKIDEFDGIIREIDGENVRVSLFDSEYDYEEFLTDLPVDLFTLHKVALREGECFYFWVEHTPPDTEKMVVCPLKRKTLTDADKKRIRNDVDDIVNGNNCGEK